MKGRAIETDSLPTTVEEHEDARDGEGEDDEDEASNILRSSNGSDVCKTLMDRYGRSSTPHHRHLCASAAAMRSILAEEGLPLTPPAYFAAAITSLRDADSADVGAISALAAFLSILLPLVPSQSLPPPKAKDAALVLASILKEPPRGTSTGTVRSMVKSLGFLALLVDLEDWSAVELPLDTLILFSVDKRPKVRRCAQVCIDKVFKALRNSIVIKNASKAILGMYKKYISVAKKVASSECSDAFQSKAISEADQMKILHMLNVINLVTPNLSDKVKMKVFSAVYKLLNSSFSVLTRPILKVIQGLLEHSNPQDFLPESDNLLSTLTSYVSLVEKNPMDTIISASTLLKDALNKLCGVQLSLWIKNLPLVITSVAGLLNSDMNTSKEAVVILKELINVHINQNILQTASGPGNSEKWNSPEALAIKAICTVFNNMISTCNTPSEDVLAVVSVLFLKLGGLSYVFMEEILLKLSHWAVHGIVEKSNMHHVHGCIGAAVMAIGPEKVLSLIPIALHAENLSCSNTWLIPILKEYVVGASLQYFMDHVVPLAKSLQGACDKATNPRRKKALKSCAYSLWNLLPAFCHYPIDTSQSFESLSKLLIVVLKEDPSLHETIAIALQELVTENRNIVKGNLHGKEERVDLPNIKDFRSETESLPFYYSKKAASRNLKALASSSMDLFQILIDIFYDSPSKKRTYLKEAIGCLASVLGVENLQSFFISSVEKLNSIYENLEDEALVSDAKEAQETTTKKQEDKDRRRLLMELTSSFVEEADEKLINLFFEYIKLSLMASNESGQCESYHTLSIILKKNSWFCSSQTDAILDLLLSTKPPPDNATLKNRLSCFHYLLVYMLKLNEEKMDAKAFLILNEIILRLKSKKESRKLAYDLLLAITACLKNSQSGKPELNLLRLFNMVMGYLSSTSPHIISGAVSALSLLIYNDARFCLDVPNLIPSVLTLLQNKDNEVIKATLGFMKVLVSSLHSNDLSQLLSDIVNGILPWSAVSKHHFKSKVSVILEILIRKCGSDAVGLVVPNKYKGFVREVEKNTSFTRQSKKNLKDNVNLDAAVQSADTSIGQKRERQDVPTQNEKHSKSGVGFQKSKRRKHENSTKEARQTPDKDGTRIADPSSPRSSFRNRFNSRGKDKKNVESKPRFGNRKNIQKKKDSRNGNYTALNSDSSAALRANKRKR